MTIHLRPSSSYRWTNCAASPSFEADLPAEPESDEAREGTAAAWVADCVLRGDAADASDLDGRSHANGHLVTPDMVFHVQRYIDLIKSFGGMTTTEKFVRLTPTIAGTLDASTALQGGVLRITDLKYGYEIVDVFENTQLLIYGGAEVLRLAALGINVASVTLGIFQPRAMHPDGIYRTWSLTVPDLWQYIEWIVARGEDCQRSQPIATPGRHCNHCRAAPSCVAFAHSAYRMFGVVQDARQHKMTAAELSLELQFIALAAKMIEARKSALFTEAETRIMKGEHVPGWGMKDTYGHRKFTVPAAVAHLLTGVDPMKKTVMTPAEFEREGANPDIVAHIAKAPVVGRKVQPVNARDFAKAFSTEGK